MAHSSQISDWLALFIGLYMLAAATGELRNPNTWWAMLKDFERSPALRLVMGALGLAVGATIYLVNPWRPEDWLAVTVSVIGGIAIAKGLLILASGDRFMHMARALIGRGGRAWAGAAALLGFALTLVAMLRINPL